MMSFTKILGAVGKKGGLILSQVPRQRLLNAGLGLLTFSSFSTATNHSWCDEHLGLEKSYASQAPQTALVTGAAGTLGAACVRSLVLEGYKVVITDVQAEGLKALASEFSEGQVKIMAVNLTDVTAVQKACGEIQREWGAVSVLVNCAGILSNNRCQDTTSQQFRHIMETNVMSAFNITQQLLPAMREQRYGRIVNTTSMAAKCGGVTAGTAYVASKGALQSLTFALARECAADGVTVNAVSPAYVRTPMVEKQLTEEQKKAVLAQVPVGRFCEPEEFAHVVMMLVHPLAGFITGEVRGFKYLRK